MAWAPAYRVGYQGYLRYTAQSAKLVAPDATTDPTAQTCSTVVGPCSMPSFDTSEGFSPVNSIGHYKDIDAAPGQRTASFSAQMQFTDCSMLATGSGIVTRGTDPDKAGTVGGLQLVTLESGFASDFGSPISGAEQGIDCLCNSFRLEAAENQPLSGSMEFWPICVIPQTTPQALAVVSNTQVLVWQHLSWEIDSVDYMAALSRASISVSNNLERVGSRKQSGALGSELAISRVPYAIVPKLEQIQVSFGLHSPLPPTLWAAKDMGTIVLEAVVPGTAPQNKLTVTIDANVFNQRQRAQASAGQMVGYTITPTSRDITIVASQTAA